MMAGFQAEENLTGRAPKKCAKNSGRYRAGNEAANLRTLCSIVMNYLTDAGKRLGSTDTRMRMMTKAGMSTKYLYSVLGYNPTEV